MSDAKSHGEMDASLGPNVLDDIEQVAEMGRQAALNGLSAVTNPYLLAEDEAKFCAWVDGYYGLAAAKFSP